MDSDLYPRDAARDVLRWFAAVLDKAIYGLLGLLYQLFFSVASADIFSSGVISKFYARVQIVIGVFVLFQLAMTILRGIVNPDEFMDSKSGAGNLIMRVCTALVMLALIVPINIPGASNEYEKQINNNGLLFGTLYSLQHRILQNNTIAKVVMGVGDSKDGNGNYMNDMSNEGLKKSSNVFVSTLVKSFYRINLIPEDDRETPAGKEDDQVVGNRVCPDMDQDVLDEYKKIEADPATIIGFVNKTCKAGNVADKYGAKTGLKSSSKVYAFTFIPLVSTLIGILFVLIFAWLTIEIAVRAIKLAILRLLAPVPIISYMDPKGGKDGAFNAWVKTLTSTYLDLFVRVATVYFVIYMIQQMISHGITTSATGALKTWTIIFIFLGLFYFAKEAPKFIKQVLGIKDDGGTGIFGGVGKVLGLGAAAGGMIGAGIASAKASRLADETQDAMAGRTGDAAHATRGINKAKHLVAGIAGGLAGGVAGASAAMGAKDHALRNTMDTLQKRNAAAIAKGSDGSTLFGRMKSSATQYFTGDGASAAVERDINTNKARLDALKAIKSRVSSEMVKSDWTAGDLGIKADNNGSAIGKVNFKHFESQLAEARAKGDGFVTFKDTNGATHTIDLADAERQRGYLLKNNEDDFIVAHTDDTRRAEVEAIDGKFDGRLVTLLHSADQIGSVAQYTRNEDGVVEKVKNSTTRVTDRSSVNDTIDALEDYNTQLARENSINKSNDRYSGGNK